MNKEIAIATIKSKLKQNIADASFESLVALMNLYIDEHPEDKVGYAILVNYLRRCEEGIDTLKDLEILNEYFSKDNTKGNINNT